MQALDGRTALPAARGCKLHLSPALLCATARRCRAPVVSCRGAPTALVAPPASAADPLLQPQTQIVSRDPNDPLRAPDPDPEALAAAAGAQRLVRVGSTPLGRGLVAKQALEKQCIVSVPLYNAMLITDEPMSGISVFGDRWLETWQEHHGRLPEQLADFMTGEARWDVRMTAWLLWVARHLRGSPVWGAYLANLPPAEQVTCLINYGPADAPELQVKAMVDEAKTQYNWATGVHRKYFDAERGELRALQLAATPQTTLWAMSMVRTRTFSETVNGENLTLMVPYADLANHAFRHNSTFCLARDQQRFELRLLESLAPGHEATITYGESKPNAEVMRDYGFVVPGNPNERLKVAAQEALPALNGASLMESIGFKGDWREGTAAPKRPTLEASHGDPAARLVLGRRRCAVLSMKLSDGLGSASSAGSEAQAQGGGGGIFGSWPPKPWTDAGRAPPQHVPAKAQAVREERSRLAVVRQAYQSSLDELPTSISTDSDLLAAHEAGGAPLSGLAEAAVRFRLEHKLMLYEAVMVLDVYDAWLVKRAAGQPGQPIQPS